MFRGIGIVSCAALALIAGACSDEGRYEITWSFGPAAVVSSGGAGGQDAGANADGGPGDAAGDGDARDAGEADAAGAQDADAGGGATDGGDAGAGPGSDGAAGGTGEGGGPDAGDDAGTDALTFALQAEEFDGEVVPAAGGCSRHGVFAIRIFGVSSDGKAEDITTPCTPGRITRSVPTGTWSFVVQALGADGLLKQPETDAAAPAGGVMLNPRVDGVVIRDGHTETRAVVFIPGPECGDGVDNDGDGRVDLDDPACKQDKNGPSEQ